MVELSYIVVCPCCPEHPPGLHHPTYLRYTLQCRKVNRGKSQDAKPMDNESIFALRLLLVIFLRQSSYFVSYGRAVQRMTSRPTPFQVLLPSRVRYTHVHTHQTNPTGLWVTCTRIRARVPDLRTPPLKGKCVNEHNKMETDGSIVDWNERASQKTRKRKIIRK